MTDDDDCCIDKYLFCVSGCLDTEQVFNEIEADKKTDIPTYSDFGSFFNSFNNFEIHKERISDTDVGQYTEDTIEYALGRIGKYIVVILQGGEYIGYGVYSENYNLIYAEFHSDDYSSEAYREKKNIIKEINQIISER